MKKLLLALTLILCLVASLVALTSCGGGTDECDHIWANKATVDKAATCTEDGSESIKCLACGEKKADSVTAIPATGHAYTVDTMTNATCTADGSKTEICTTCGNITTTTLPATGEHTWSDIPTIDVEATCTTEGSKSIKCVTCQAVKPDSTEVIPAAHVWGVIATTDTPATCTEPGTKSIKCLFCQTKQAGTEETVPATGHSDVAVTVIPTMFSEGFSEGECSACGQTVSASIPMTVPTVYSSATNGGEIKETYSFESILNGGETHFYPTEDDPDGKALYVEYSFLWNPTLLDIRDGYGYMTSPRIEGDNSNNYDAAYWISIKNDEKTSYSAFAGSFEVIVLNEVIYGPPMDAEDLPKEDYPNFGEYGWHRIGIEMKQTVTVSGDDVNKKMIVTLYIDGVKVSQYDMGIRYNSNWLYDAEIIDGELVYADIPLSADVLPYYFPSIKTVGENHSYVLTADVYITAGDGFVFDVTPVTNPESETYEVEEGVELPGNVYFEFVNND